MSWKIKVLTSALLLNAFSGKVDGFVDGKVCLIKEYFETSYLI